MKRHYMLETPSMQQYESFDRENLNAADNQQGRLEREPSTTIRVAPKKRVRRKLRKPRLEHKGLEGYQLDEQSHRWKRHIKDGLAWCCDCREWKPIDNFCSVVGHPYQYCKACQRLHKAMCRYSITREEAVRIYATDKCICCGSEFKKQTHRHIHHVDGEVIGLVCLFCNHILRSESAEHLYRLKCCVEFIENRVKIESEHYSDVVR